MREHSTHRLSPIARLLATLAVLLFCLGFTITSVAPAAPHAEAHKHGKKHHKKKCKKGKKKPCKKKRKKRRARKASAPLTGIYDSCTYSGSKKVVADCSDRLAVLRQGGFEVVLNYATDAMSVEDNLRYADAAQSLGMRVIWNLGSYKNLNTGAFSPLAPKLDLVRATMNHPATWGYYIGDEHPEYLPLVTELSHAVRSLTDRPLLYVSRPNPSKLRPFKGLADYLGPDIYPVGPIDRASVCRTARWASKMAGSGLAMVLQAYSWSIDYPSMNAPWPSGGQMRQMRDQAMRCGNPKLLLWFCFHCVTDYNPDPESYWREVAWAANGASLGASYRMSSVRAAG
jgi:hypothetical protein